MCRCPGTPQPVPGTGLLGEQCCPGRPGPQELLCGDGSCRQALGSRAGLNVCAGMHQPPRRLFHFPGIRCVQGGPGGAWGGGQVSPPGMKGCGCDGRGVKALDSKSNRVSLRRFESCSQRETFTWCHTHRAAVGVRVIPALHILPGEQFCSREPAPWLKLPINTPGRSCDGPSAAGAQAPLRSSRFCRTGKGEEAAVEGSRVWIIFPRCRVTPHHDPVPCLQETWGS